MKKVRNPVNTPKKHSHLERAEKSSGEEPGTAPGLDEETTRQAGGTGLSLSHGQTVSDLERERHEWISQRAYSLWEQAGRPEGRHADHWEQAISDFEQRRNVNGEAGADGGGKAGSSVTSRAR
ncbi:DUF2934 domain-containing protein [Rhizobium sp. 2MFCol3.1]|uniref:DUF2934 domain-containing protein n=1 Tax=Rhizobium sp. 2MFCol3.1 TaxID=1246459 RepID=UPI000361581F|nr:DUF2934 domain-containing protein [Rhizobium sp. 2MFCol3.1]